MVRAVEEFGCTHMLSSVCEPGLEDLAKAAPKALRLYQLYVRGDAAWVDDHVARAIEHGYAAFALTVDTAHYSRRERDIAKRFVTAGRRRVQNRAAQASLDWRTVERIKTKFKIPLAIKGIATAEDAKIAIEHGVDWIYVSNHGGRQLDHGRGSMDALPEVVEAVAGRAGIIVDGSICRGTDIVKALATGADLVGIGRMQCYALACGGQSGVLRLLELLEDEVQRCLGLLGVTRVRRSRPLLSLRRRAGQRAARAQRVSAAQDRRLPVLTVTSPRPRKFCSTAATDSNLQDCAHKLCAGSVTPHAVLRAHEPAFARFDFTSRHNQEAYPGVTDCLVSALLFTMTAVRGTNRPGLLSIRPIEADAIATCIRTSARSGTRRWHRK